MLPLSRSDPYPNSPTFPCGSSIACGMMRWTGTNHMRVYELQRREGLDALTAAERTAPEAGPHDIRVRVAAVSLNYRDLAIARLAVRRTKGPIIPCSDGAGEVVAVGAAVTRFKPGRRVAAIV